MKEIKAYIKSRKLMDVTLALQKVDGLTGMSVTDVRGFGLDRRTIKASKGQDTDPADYEPYVKIEIFCFDSLVDEIVTIIETAAHTGLHGDGKIYVSNVELALCIETGLRGEQAI